MADVVPRCGRCSDLLVMLIDVVPGEGKMELLLWQMLWLLILMADIMQSERDRIDRIDGPMPFLDILRKFST